MTCDLVALHMPNNLEVKSVVPAQYMLFFDAPSVGTLCVPSTGVQSKIVDAGRFRPSLWLAPEKRKGVHGVRV